MRTNPYRIVIELEPSDGFHTRDNEQLADIVRGRVMDMIMRDVVGTDEMVRTVRVETTEQ